MGKIKIDTHLETAQNQYFKEIYNNRKIVHDFLEQCSVLYAGRFGKWDYLWSDQSVLSAIEIVDKI